MRLLGNFRKITFFSLITTHPSVNNTHMVTIFKRGNCCACEHYHNYNYRVHFIQRVTKSFIPQMLNEFVSQRTRTVYSSCTSAAKEFWESRKIKSQWLGKMHINHSMILMCTLYCTIRLLCYPQILYLSFL